MRKILAVLTAIILVSAIPAMSAERFVSFPTLGVCTGSSVRYRGEPNTRGEIWGRLELDEKVIVEGRKIVNGEVWYEISPKDAQDSAYVFGKYLVPYFDEDTQSSSAGKMIIDVLQTYCPYRDHDYWGEYDGEYVYPEVRRKFDSQGWLVRVEAWEANKDFGFGDIHIGDSEEKLTEILGDPDEDTGPERIYMAGSSASLTFRVEDGKITRMIYEE